MRRGAWAQKFTKIDVFGQPFEFGLPDKTKLFKTVPGAICTLILMLILMAFAGFKFNSLVQLSQYRILSETFAFEYDAEDKFGFDNDFRVAASITEFGVEKDFEDPTYGTVKLVMKYWNGSEPLRFYEFPTRNCGFKDDAAKGEMENGFFPLLEKMEGLKTYRNYMKCIDEEQLRDDEPFEIFGDFDSDAARNLMVVFDRCIGTLEDGVTPCQKPEVINQWLQKKYIFVLQNEIKYLQHIDDGDERLKKTSIMTQHAVSGDTRSDFPRLVHHNAVQYNILPWGINVNQQNESIFDY